MAEPLIFLGAGASQPFDIPTMEGFVDAFSKELESSGTTEEKDLYADIKNSTTNIFGRVDLEAVFSLVNVLTEKDWGTGLGSFSPFFYKRYLDVSLPPIFNLEKISLTKLEEDVKIALELKKKFESFVREECEIKDDQYEPVYEVYTDFFNNLSRGSGFMPKGGTRKQSVLLRQWPMFTTNYDLCVEEFCKEFNINLNTGVYENRTRRQFQVNTRLLNADGSDHLSLAKLHGSLKWFRHDDGSIIERAGQSGVGMRTYGLHKIVGEVMIFPIRQKEMYLDPYLEMIYFFARKLKECKAWLIIGYQFNDDILRTMFETYSSEDKTMILVDPKVDEIQSRLNLKCRIIPIREYFGGTDTSTIIGDNFKSLKLD